MLLDWELVKLPEIELALWACQSRPREAMFWRRIAASGHHLREEVSDCFVNYMEGVEYSTNCEVDQTVRKIHRNVSALTRERARVEKLKWRGQPVDLSQC